MPWLQLIRWKNLLVIFLTQLLAWWCIVIPAGPAVLYPVNFLCIALSTVLIAAAGYIINDYFDVKIDSINKPDKVVLEKAIPRKQAIILHTVLNFIALVLAVYVARQAYHYEWVLLQLVCTLLLWFYSTHFKRQYVTGNLVVALLTALTMLTLFIYEPTLQYLVHTGIPSSLPVWVLFIYAYFAFMLTWMREIVKDMEDIKGDEAEQCVTMPIKKGLSYATRFTIMLSLLAVIPLVFASGILFGFGYNLLAGYIIVLLALPLIAWSVFITRSTAEEHYSNASHLLKLIMILGVCSLLIYHR
ncbi:MAG: ubiquinone biosynthesis protein UbiA [Flavipsychrobacter sp.]|nr:ubiquinone biosynthesis protein UbiA [Flavipsychrobacter sp.]